MSWKNNYLGDYDDNGNEIGYKWNTVPDTRYNGKAFHDLCIRMGDWVVMTVALVIVLPIFCLYVLIVED